MSEPSLNGLRVLVLDAGVGLVRTICTILRDMDIDDVMIVDSPGKALEILRGRNFDLILGHTEMPGFSAAPFARLLRGNSAAVNAATPFILIAERPEKSELLAALEAGVTGFLIGIFTPARLREQILSVLQVA